MKASVLAEYELDGIRATILRAEHALDGRVGLHIVPGIEPNEITAVLHDELWLAVKRQGNEQQLLTAIHHILVGHVSRTHPEYDES